MTGQWPQSTSLSLARTYSFTSRMTSSSSTSSSFDVVEADVMKGFSASSIGDILVARRAISPMLRTSGLAFVQRAHDEIHVADDARLVLCGHSA